MHSARSVETSVRPPSSSLSSPPFPPPLLPPEGPVCQCLEVDIANLPYWVGWGNRWLVGWSVSEGHPACSCARASDWQRMKNFLFRRLPFLSLTTTYTFDSTDSLCCCYCYCYLLLGLGGGKGGKGVWMHGHTISCRAIGTDPFCLGHSARKETRTGSPLWDALYESMFFERN